MSLPLAFQIWWALARIASTALRIVFVDVRKAMRRRRALNAVADSRPAGAVFVMRRFGDVEHLHICLRPLPLDDLEDVCSG